MPHVATHQQPLGGEVLGEFFAAHGAALIAVLVEVKAAHDTRPARLFESLLLAARTARNVGGVAL
ncbi:MAG: hypothetical protein IPO13_07095 [Rhodocyclaceae bacterium]|nr:hypothetical protein [Rhodocyclaceae bacterium]